MAAAFFLALRCLLAAVFGVAGVMKVGRTAALEKSIDSYGLVHRSLQRPMARALPILEILLGLVLGLGVLPVVAGAIGFLTLSAFALAVSWNLARGRRFACGCGTAHDSEISWGLVWRDGVLAVIALAVALGPAGALAVWRDSSTLPSHAPSSSQLLAIPMIVLLGLAVVRLLVAKPPVWRSAARPVQAHSHRAAPNHGLEIVTVNGRLSGQQPPAKDA